MHLNHPQAIPTPPHPWKNCLPWNRSLVPTSWGTIALEDCSRSWDSGIWTTGRDPSWLRRVPRPPSCFRPPWSPFSLWPVFAASGWSSPPPCAQIRDPRPGRLWGGSWESPDTDHVLVTDILSGDWDFALSYNSGIFCCRSLEMLNIISYTFKKHSRKSWPC